MREKKKKNNKSKGNLVVLFTILFLICGFLVYFGKAGTLFKKAKTNIPKPVPEVKKLKIVDEDSNSRPIAVMINNNHDAWPHAGLQDAYLNYEIIVEGGITRIMSLFKDKDTSKIGSVRSSRHYYLDYVLENDAIYVHFGYSDQAASDIKSLGINNINGLVDSTAFWRDTTLKKAYEHTAFTSMEKINNLITNKGYRTTTDKGLLLNYTTDEVDLSKHEGSQKCDSIEIEYSNYQTTSYEYDSEKKVYLRSMSNNKHVDAITGEQYTAKNIITYQVNNRTIDSYGRQDLDNIGSGTGYYITNGYAVPITWEKSSRSGKTVYKYSNGKEINVSDGNTWIQIQPKGKNLQITGAEEIVDE